jgi:hypothetical protein
MSALVISLSALVLVALGAYAPADVAAADIAFLADSPELKGDHTGLHRKYGTFAGVWTGYLDRVVTANSNPELDRNYGTFAGVWTGYVDQVTTADPNLVELDRNYGTFAGVWTGYANQVVTVTSNPESDRNYGTFAGVWTGYLDQVATQFTQAQ